jgi:hypothetical protein
MSQNSLDRNWEKKYDAPEGAVWVCGACGKNGRNSTRIGDESCFMNAVLCVDDKPASVSPFDHDWKPFPTA